jgi:predicted dehydrogenase
MSPQFWRQAGQGPSSKLTETISVSLEQYIMSETNPIKVGVIGLGRSGWNIHVRRLRNDRRFQVSAVVDLQEGRRREAIEEFNCQGFTDYRDMLEKGDVELVVIASQSVDHGPQSIAATLSGRHVVVEKPMAMNTDEATAMIEAAESAGVELFVHQNYRYQLDVQHIREIIASGLLGNVFEVRIRVLKFARRNDWQTLQKYGGGNLNNTCPHFIDAALLLLESPVARMFSDLQLTTDVGDADDHSKLLLKGENGRLIDLEVSTSCAFSEPKWTVLGTAGTLRSDGKTSEIKYFDPAKAPELIVDEAPPSARQYGSGDVLPWVEESRPSVGTVTSDFYDNVYAVLREGAAKEILPEQVREVIRIIEAAHRENAPL